MSSCR